MYIFLFVWRMDGEKNLLCNLLQFNATEQLITGSVLIFPLKITQNMHHVNQHTQHIAIKINFVSLCILLLIWQFS